MSKFLSALPKTIAIADHRHPFGVDLVSAGMALVVMIAVGAAANNLIGMVTAVSLTIVASTYVFWLADNPGYPVSKRIRLRATRKYAWLAISFVGMSNAIIAACTVTFVAVSWPLSMSEPTSFLPSYAWAYNTTHLAAVALETFTVTWIALVMSRRLRP